mmetsp:Transcript_3917/g.12017  ORF Transcript_3917/g.12017 Transcript_3917/m.12017 type:complete len:203 (+) Transcript_3917:1214-1822(+)
MYRAGTMKPRPRGATLRLYCHWYLSLARVPKSGTRSEPSNDHVSMAKAIAGAMHEARNLGCEKSSVPAWRDLIVLAAASAYGNGRGRSTTNLRLRGIARKNPIMHMPAEYATSFATLGSHVSVSALPNPAASRISELIASTANGIDPPQTIAVAATATVISTQFSWAVNSRHPKTRTKVFITPNPKIAALMLFVTVYPYLTP